MEVKQEDVDLAVDVLAREYQQSTALASHDLSTAGAVFDEQAASTLCPACGCTFSTTTTTCPECGLSFGQ